MTEYVPTGMFVTTEFVGAQLTSWPPTTEMFDPQEVSSSTWMATSEPDCSAPDTPDSIASAPTSTQAPTTAIEVFLKFPLRSTMTWPPVFRLCFRTTDDHAVWSLARL